MSSYRQRLIEYARAGFSGVAVVTQEVGRAKTETLVAAQTLDREYREWRCTTGWLKAQSENGRIQLVDDSGGSEGAPSGPPEGVQEIAQGPNGCVYVMEVFDEFFRDPNARQMLRDVLGPAREQRKLVVLVGTFAIPADLDKELSTIEFDLPNRESLEVIARELLESVEVEVPPEDELAKVVDGALGLTEIEAQDAFSLSLVRNQQLDVQSVIDIKRGIVERSGILEFVDTPESLDSVGGLDILKDWLKIRERGFSPEARQFGVAPPRGLLLVGISGCGKSQVAKSISAAWKLPCIRLDVGRAMGSLVGESERNMRMVYQVTSAIAPVLVFVDEFEKMFAGLGGASTDGGTTQRVIGGFLSWMQDRTNERPCFIVATANDISALPPEMLRKGRWDETFFVGLPNSDERKEIFAIHLIKTGRKPEDFDADVLAKVSEGFTGAEIEETVKGALWKAFAQDRDLRMGDLNEAARETIPLSRGPMKEIVTSMHNDNRFRRASSVQESDSKGRKIDV